VNWSIALEVREKHQMISQLRAGAARNWKNATPLSCSFPGFNPPAAQWMAQTPCPRRSTPPHGRPGEGPMDLPFRIEYLDAERLLPVLVRKAA
jgi:hypothetical protein